MEKNIIDQLRDVMHERSLSPEEAARYCEVGFMSIYRWLKGETTPSAVYRRAVQLGIKRMKKLPPVRPLRHEIDRDIYRKLKKRITVEEKRWLLDVDGNYSMYRQRLRELALKKGIAQK